MPLPKMRLSYCYGGRLTAEATASPEQVPLASALNRNPREKPLHCAHDVPPMGQQLQWTAIALKQLRNAHST